MGDNKKALGPVLGFDERPVSDGGFGQRLCGEPPYRADCGDDFNDTRFAPLDTSGSGQGSKDLKKFLEKQIAKQTPATAVGVLGETFIVYYDEGKDAWRASGKLNGTKHAMTGKSRDEVLNKLVRLGQRVEAETIHDLSPSQEIEVARLCQSGNKSEGIARYLRYRIGEERGSEYDSPGAMTADPSLQNVMAECAYFCWLNSRADVRDSEEFRTFLSDYAGSRPINFDLLNAGWTAFLPHQEKQATRAAVAHFAEPEQPSAREIEQGLEELPDADVEKMMAATKREYVRQVRAGAR